MGGVEGIQAGVAGHAAGAADAGDDGHAVQVGFGIDEGAGEAVDGGADAAAGAPDVRHAVHAQEWLDGILRSDFDHSAASRMASRICCGSCTLPPAWGMGITRVCPRAARSTSQTI